LRQPATSAAKFGAARIGVSRIGVARHGRDNDRNARLGQTGPEQRDDPADERPAQEKVEQENRGEALAMPRNKRRQEINEYGGQHQKHGVARFGSALPLPRKSPLR